MELADRKEIYSFIRNNGPVVAETGSPCEPSLAVVVLALVNAFLLALLARYLWSHRAQWAAHLAGGRLRTAIPASPGRNPRS